MPHLDLDSRPRPVLIEGDPFGLHEPLTLDDVLRIEEALASDDLSDSERERLQAIYNDAVAPLRKTMQQFASRLAGTFKIDWSKLLPSLEEQWDRPVLGSPVVGFQDADVKVRTVHHELVELSSEEVNNSREMLARLDILAECLIKAEEQAAVRHAQSRRSARWQFALLLVAMTVIGAATILLGR